MIQEKLKCAKSHRRFILLVVSLINAVVPAHLYDKISIDNSLRTEDYSPERCPCGLFSQLKTSVIVSLIYSFTYVHINFHAQFNLTDRCYKLVSSVNYFNFSNRISQKLVTSA